MAALRAGRFSLRGEKIGQKSSATVWHETCVLANRARIAQDPMMESHEKLAHSHGFASFAELLNSSRQLPLEPRDGARTYIARDRYGYWFVWEDETSEEAAWIGTDRWAW